MRERFALVSILIGYEVQPLFLSVLSIVRATENVQFAQHQGTLSLGVMNLLHQMHHGNEHF